MKKNKKVTSAVLATSMLATPMMAQVGALTAKAANTYTCPGCGRDFALAHAVPDGYDNATTIPYGNYDIRSEYPGTYVRQGLALKFQDIRGNSYAADS